MRNKQEDFNYILKKYEAARANGGSLYFEVAELLDIYDYYANNYRNDEAHEVLMRAVKLFPDDQDVVVAHAYYHKNTGNWKQARSIINKLEPENLCRKIFYAEEALMHCDIEENRRLVEEIVQTEPEITYDTALDIAEMYYEAGYYHLAEPWLERCNTPQYAEFSRAAGELADCLFRRGELEAAIAVMNKSLDEDPYDAESWVQLAKIQYTAKKDNEALESCDYAIAANKEYAEAYSVRFDTLVRLKQYDEMWESLQNPMQQMFCSAENLLQLALGFERDKQHEKASQVYHLAARLFLDNNEARDQIHHHLAHEAILQNKPETARDLLFRYADRENYLMRYGAWATLLFIVNKPEEALENLEYMFTLPGFSGKEANEMCALLFNAKCYEQAQKVWDKLIDYSTDEDFHFHAMLAYGAFQIHSDKFPSLLNQAMKEDLFHTIHLLGSDIDLLNKKKAMKQAHDLVKQWKEQQ